MFLSRVWASSDIIGKSETSPSVKFQHIAPQPVYQLRSICEAWWPWLLTSTSQRQQKWHLPLGTCKMHQQWTFYDLLLFTLKHRQDGEQATRNTVIWGMKWSHCNQINKRYIIADVWCFRRVNNNEHIYSPTRQNTDRETDMYSVE